MKEYFKNFIKTFFMVLISLFLVIWGFIVYALTFPASPTWQVDWGKFTQYFNELTNGFCPDWQYLNWFNTDFTRNCLTAPAGATWPQWPAGATWPQWPAWPWISGSPTCTRSARMGETGWAKDCPSWQYMAGYRSDYRNSVREYWYIKCCSF